MFSIYLVFGRRRIRVGDPRTAERGDQVTLLESWIPEAKPGETPDNRMEKEGLPKISRLAEFCFARKKNVDDVSGLVPPALSFIFTLTSSNGERTHCYCLRAHRPNDEHSHRIDVGGEWIEASLFVTKFPFHRLFPAALQICRVRRFLDKESNANFLQQLHNGLASFGETPLSPSSSTVPKGSISVESPCMSVSCKYEFPLSKDPRLDSIFETMSPQVLSYVIGAILLERRVCLVGKHEKRLSDVSYALTYLACGEAPLKGYCHNFVPVLPNTMLELGLGNPAPYIVGILRSYFKATDSIKELGDVVTVDLDSKVVRVTPSGSPVLPLGIEFSSEPITGGTSRSAGEPVNPWQDVCGPFQRDLTSAFSTKNSDLLLAAVRAVVLLVTVGKPGVHLEDKAVSEFASQFRKTQIAAAAQSANETAIAVLLGNKGYAGLRSQLISQQQATFGPERTATQQANQAVLEITGSGGAKGRSDLVTRHTGEIAKKTFDVSVFYEGVDAAIKARLADCQGRNWKYAYKTLGLLNLLLRMGSELVIASCLDDLGTLFELTRFSISGVVGVPSRVAELVQKRAKDVYSLLVDLHTSRFVRSVSGHIMFQRHTRQKMQTSVNRVPIGKDLKTLLELCAPAPIVEAEGEDDQPSSGRPTSLFSGLNRPPPPPPTAQTIEGFSVASAPALQSVLGGKAPPPPPPLPSHSGGGSANGDGLLIDLETVQVGVASLSINTSSMTSPSADELFNFPPTPIIVSDPTLSIQAPPSPSRPGPPGNRPPASKLISAYESKISTSGRADTKLITAYDTPAEGKGANASDRPRRPRTLENNANGVMAAVSNLEAQSASNSPPSRPMRGVPAKTFSDQPDAQSLTSDPKESTISSPSSKGTYPRSPIAVPAKNFTKPGPPGVTKKSPSDQSRNSPDELGKKALNNAPSSTAAGPPGVRPKPPPPPPNFD